MRAPSRLPSRPADDAPSETQGALLAELKELFAEQKWGFSEVDGAPAIVSELSGPLGRWKLCVQVVEEVELVIVYSICPLTIPEDRRLAVADFLTRVNYGLTLGCFELDFSDGEVRCKAVLAIDTRPVKALLVERLIRVSGRLMETFLPGIRAVAYGTDPVEAADRLRAALP